MSFAVDTRAVAGLPTLLDRLHEDAGQARVHLDRHTEISWTGTGVINVLAGGHRHVQDEVRTFLDGVMNRVAAPTAGAVRASIQYYQSVDHASAAILDRTFPPAQADQGCGAGGEGGEGGKGDVATRPPVAHFRDIAEPQRYYTPPPDYNGEYPHEPEWHDLVSPGALLRDAIWTVTGVAANLGICDRAYDPYEVALKPLVGDWAGLRACADVFGDLADAVAAMGDNVRGAAQSTQVVWTGQAASACVAHLTRIADALRVAPQPLRDMAEKYENAATSMNEFRKTIGAIINDVADAAIMAAASAGVVALAGATGAGLPVALIIGAFTLTRIYKVAHAVVTAVDLIGRFKAMMSAFASAQDSFGRIDGTVSLPTLPDAVPALPR